MRIKSPVFSWVLFACVALATCPAWAGKAEHSIAGVYAFEGVGKYGPGDFSSPLVDFRQIKPSSEIEIADTGSSSVRLRFVRTDGAPVETVIDLGQARFVRHDGAIEFEVEIAPVGARILPGKTILTKKLVFKRDEQGNLRIHRTIAEKGFILFLIPFSEKHESTLTLPRAG
ncbi:hypothetical protein [Massilia cavernae]|uniref:Uncharacterized protein n=1 Tax=Massilia cavernae TaxID=2320864 RepID=A0A418XTF2_9BURK|nr:hypothetical protein [Massilia cavernae]RJG15875.1 hypothetical protein D3872_11725 [Massilia cavernae]